MGNITGFLIIRLSRRSSCQTIEYSPNKQQLSLVRTSFWQINNILQFLFPPQSPQPSPLVFLKSGQKVMTVSSIYAHDLKKPQTNYHINKTPKRCLRYHGLYQTSSRNISKYRSKNIINQWVPELTFLTKTMLTATSNYSILEEWVAKSTLQFWRNFTIMIHWSNWSTGSNR